MRLFDLPIPFFSNSGRIQVLLTTVGLRLPAAFQNMHKIIMQLCNTLELDIRSIAPDFINVVGQVKFDISVCESSDALPFLLGLSDPLSPHLDFHVVVGAAIAESQQELLACTRSFDCIVKESVSNAVPCLFVFTSSTFDGSCLPACATQIPSYADEQDVIRRVREGFVRCSMEFLMGARAKCEDLYEDFENPESLLKLGSYSYMYGAVELANDFYAAASRGRSPEKTRLGIQSNIMQMRYFHKNLNFEYNTPTDHDLPSGLGECKNIPSELQTAISLAWRCDKIVLTRALLRAASAGKESSKPLLVWVINMADDLKLPQFEHYKVLALLLLVYTRNERTFLFRTSMYVDSGENVPAFLLQIFAEVITNGGDWCDQRIIPAAKLLTNASVSRAVKNRLMTYLLSYLHKITDPEKQLHLLSLIPAGMEIDAMKLIDVRGIDPEPSANPITKAQTYKSKVFIYCPLKQGKDELRCSVGDTSSFSVTIFNPLAVPLECDISLTATNATTYPSIVTIPPKKSIAFALMVKADEIGDMEISGFRFTTGNLSVIYELPAKIRYQVVEKVPILVVKQPARFETKIMENRKVEIPFKIVNTSDVDVGIRNMTFGPMPPVLTPTSLPIGYPPLVTPPLPEVIRSGSVHNFALTFDADQTYNVLSYAIEYGTENYCRGFTMNEPLTIMPGPKIRSVQVVSLDNHDDFDTNTVTFMIVIENPLSMPLMVRRSGTHETIIVDAHSLGTYMVDVERTSVTVSDKWTDVEIIEKEHVRKCEVVGTKEKNSALDLNEKQEIWASLLLKKNLQDQIKLDWELSNGETGTLPFTHVPIDAETLVLLQPPKFKVEYTLEKYRENIWLLVCKVDSEESVKLRAKLSFDIGEQTDSLLVAGAEENAIQTPASFQTYIHCLPGATLAVVGKFYVSNAYFVKRASFDLS